MQKNNITAQKWQQARHFLYQLSVGQFPHVHDMRPDRKSRYQYAILLPKRAEAEAAVQRALELRHRLFIEFCNTPRTPNPNLYLEDRTSPEQRRQGWGQHGYTPAYENILDQLHSEFIKLVVDQRRNPIADHYLTHSIDDTPLVSLLKEFEGEMSELVETAYKEEITFDKERYIEGRTNYMLSPINTYCVENEWSQSAINALLYVLIDSVRSCEAIKVWHKPPVGRVKNIARIFKRVADALTVNQPTPGLFQSDHKAAIRAEQSYSKRPLKRLLTDFTGQLRNGFTETDLNGLLVHIGFKNKEGQTLSFTAYLLHQAIDALIGEGYFEADTSRERDQKALQRFLGLLETRVTVEYGETGKSVKQKAMLYLSELTNQRKTNG